MTTRLTIDIPDDKASAVYDSFLPILNDGTEETKRDHFVRVMLTIIQRLDQNLRSSKALDPDVERAKPLIDVTEVQNP